MSTFNEQRHFTRIPFDADVTLTEADNSSQVHQARLIDICLKGALVSKPTDWSPEIGKDYLLSLNLGSSDDTRLNMEASIAHMEDSHIGFEIRHMDLDTATHLHRLVELNLGDEKLLERELSELVGLDD